MGAVNMYVGSLNTAITLNFRLDRIGQGNGDLMNRVWKALWIVMVWALIIPLWGVQYDGGKSPFRLATPTSPTGSGTGWSVSTPTGELAFSTSVATVPGEIPIPVNYRMAAGHKVVQSVHYYPQVVTNLIITYRFFGCIFGTQKNLQNIHMKH
jgi:hypothetical protein